MTKDIKKICMWSTPRSTSTLLMYSFLSREDVQVIDSPLSTYFQNSSKISHYKHPARTKKYDKIGGDKVINNILNEDYNKPILFIKELIYYMFHVDHLFLKDVKNIILIRNPKKIINSYLRKMPKVQFEDIGVDKQLKLYESLVERNIKPIVIDSDDLLYDPYKMLNKICNYLEIPFSENMLKWESGPKKEDGQWASHWYIEIHNSTGFKKIKNDEVKIPDEYISLYEKCYEYYNILYQERIKLN